jgi:hypothetical protein
LIEVVAWVAFILAIFLLMGAGFSMQHALHVRNSEIIRRHNEIIELKEQVAMRDRELESQKVLLRETRKRLEAQTPR